MKAIKLMFICFSLITALNANELFNKNTQEIFDAKKKQGELEALIIKDSWINPLSLQGDISKSKLTGSNKEVEAKKINLGFNQDIFRSGAIYKTVRKGKLLNNLNVLTINVQEKNLISSLYDYVISLKKIDLQIKKRALLIINQKIEINKKESLYTNGLIDISDLDQSVIDLNNLTNESDDLQIEKLALLQAFAKYSNLSYVKVNLAAFKEFDLEYFLKNSSEIKIKELSVKTKKLDKKITATDFLPKLSIYGEVGYEDNQQNSDDYHMYGLKLTLPFSYNSSKEKSISRLNEVIAKKELIQSKAYEKNYFEMTQNKISYINKKLVNLNETIKRYKSLYTNVYGLYENSLKTIEDVEILKNRVMANNFEKDILQLDKKALLNKLYSKI